MTEHYTVRRVRDRNAKIVSARATGASIRALMAGFDLSQAQIYRIIKDQTTKEFS